MALAAPTQFETRSGGSDTLNGGGFNPGSANFLTDLAVSSANTSAPVVSSASYNFVAGDVGARFFLKSGTNGIPGWYVIASVASNQATLTATIGSAILYDATIQCNGLNTVVGCGATSSLTSQTGGIDYSQQNAVQFALTGVTTAAANAILLTVSAANSMLGQVLQIISGTNFTAGFYEVIAVSVGVSITVDRNATSAAGALGVVKIGGALATINKIGGTIVAGNSVWAVGTFTLTSSDSISANGTIGVPIFIRGYATYRGDGYQGRTSNVKGLVTTNYATLNYNSTFRFNLTGSFYQIESLNISGNVTTTSLTIAGTDCIAKGCKAVNANTGAGALGVSLSSRCKAVDCDFALTGASGGSAAAQCTSTGSALIACHITGSPSIGINAAATSIVLNCLVFGCTSHGIFINATSSAVSVMGSTITGCGGDAINVITATTGIQLIHGNMITDNTGAGINMVSTSNSAMIMYNFFRNNTGNVTNTNQWTASELAQNGNVQATTGAANVDYTSQATGDYSLAAASPARNASQPYAASFGAFQSAAGGGMPQFGHGSSFRGKV